jgi:cysteinyl-tRNA synthetase
MKLFDSRTQKKVEIVNDTITIYNCGPTVYNDTHIGNARPLIIFDVLIKYLNAIKQPYKYIHNLTDVDDKIIDQAEKLAISEKQLTTKYIDAYFDIMQKLNITKPSVMPLVTENIIGIIDYVKKLCDLQKAYFTSNGDVYFSIESVKQIYGQISKQNIKTLLNDVRKETSKLKHYPLDFAL